MTGASSWSVDADSSADQKMSAFPSTITPSNANDGRCRSTADGSASSTTPTSGRRPLSHVSSTTAGGEVGGGEEEEAGKAAGSERRPRRRSKEADVDGREGITDDGDDEDVPVPPVMIVDDDDEMILRDPLLPHLIVVSSPSSSPASASGQVDVRTALLTEGYCVIPSVLTRAECTSFLEQLWDYVEVTSGGRVRRDDPTTYYPRNNHEIGRDDGGSGGEHDINEDPWPCSGWGSFPDMFQSNGAGWIFGELREILADRVFSPLVFGTEKLHSSKEGFTFHRPRRYRRRVGGAHGSASPKKDDDCDDVEGEDDGWECWVDDCHPAYRHLDHHSHSDVGPSANKDDDDIRRRRRGRTFRVCGKNQLNVVGEHFDQSSSSYGLCHVQSATSLLDQDEEDGCFLCWPGSHVFHRRLTEDTYRGKFPWVPLTDDDLTVLREVGGLKPVRVPVSAGDVILWRSDLVHAALSPSHRADGFRAVAYVAMMPAELTEDKVWERKLEGYKRMRTGDHRADLEVWHDDERGGGGRRRRRRVRSSGVVNGRGAAAADDDDGAAGEEEVSSAIDGTDVFVPRYFHDGPPRLTWRQAELYCLVPYRRMSPKDRSNEILHALGRGVRFVPEVEAEADASSSPSVCGGATTNSEGG